MFVRSYREATLSKKVSLVRDPLLNSQRTTRHLLNGIAPKRLEDLKARAKPAQGERSASLKDLSTSDNANNVLARALDLLAELGCDHGVRAATGDCGDADLGDGKLLDKDGPRHRLCDFFPKTEAAAVGATPDKQLAGHRHHSRVRVAAGYGFEPSLAWQREESRLGAVALKFLRDVAEPELAADTRAPDVEIASSVDRGVVGKSRRDVLYVFARQRLDQGRVLSVLALLGSLSLLRAVVPNAQSPIVAVPPRVQLPRRVDGDDVVSSVIDW